MKKIAIAFAAMMAAFSFVSCNKEKTPAQTEMPKVRFVFTVGDLAPETKAAKTGWTDGDRINIWFDDNCEVTPDLVLTYNGATWDSGKPREGVSFANPGGKISAMYESLNDLSKYKMEKDAEKGNLCFSYGKSSMVAYNVGRSDYSYSEREGTLSATLDNWSVISGVQVTLTGLPEGEFALCADADGALGVANCFILDAVNGIEPYGSTFGFAESQSKEGEAVFFFYALQDSDVEYKDVTFILFPKVDGSYSSSSERAYSTTIPLLKKTGTYQPFRVSYDKFKPSINGHQYVDLGDGRKWATMNIGATSKALKGDFFAWAETQTKDTFVWSNYQHLEEGYLNKYVTAYYWDQHYDELDWKPNIDNVTDLATYNYEDDAARQLWGSTWRVPSKDELSWLCTVCNWEPTSEGGVDGYRVTGPSENSIFLPSSGFQEDEPIDQEMGEKEKIPSAGYWSSSLVQENW